MVKMVIAHYGVYAALARNLLKPVKKSSYCLLQVAHAHVHAQHTWREKPGVILLA